MTAICLSWAPTQAGAAAAGPEKLSWCYGVSGLLLGWPRFSAFPLNTVLILGPSYLHVAQNPKLMGTGEQGGRVWWEELPSRFTHTALSYLMLPICFMYLTTVMRHRCFWGTTEDSVGVEIQRRISGYEDSIYGKQKKKLPSDGTARRLKLWVEEKTGLHSRSRKEQSGLVEFHSPGQASATSSIFHPFYLDCWGHQPTLLTSFLIHFPHIGQVPLSFTTVKYVQCNIYQLKHLKGHNSAVLNTLTMFCNNPC